MSLHSLHHSLVQLVQYQSLVQLVQNTLSGGGDSVLHVP